MKIFSNLWILMKAGRFEPDFVMLLKEENHKISIYQVFIEPKGEFLDKNDEWKQKFLLDIRKKF